jgi:SAM-dependent methyltransferase
MSANYANRLQRAIEQAPRLRALARSVIPFAARKLIHRVLAQPFLAHDALPDALDYLRVFGPSLPPPALRERVSWTSSRDEFQRVGKAGAAAIEEAFVASRDPEQSYSQWLDFGCGCGRLARHLTRAAKRELTGVDVDARAIAWAHRHLKGTYLTIPRHPPTPFPRASFDVAVVASVFTHLNEHDARSWLAELHRILRPGGLLISTTHGAHLAYIVPNLSATQSDELARRGHLFYEGSGGFNSSAAFYTREYLEAAWQPHFTLRWFKPSGHAGYQDISAWVRAEGSH